MKNARYLLLLIIGLVLLSASFTIEATKTKASPGSCVSGDTCYFFVEWDWCTTGSNCNMTVACIHTVVVINNPEHVFIMT